MKYLLGLVLFCLAACAPGGGSFHALSVTSTDNGITASDPLIIQPLSGGTPISLGELKGDRWDVKRDGDNFETTMDLRLEGKDGQSRWNQQVTLKGQIEPDGTAILKPTTEDKNNLPVRARVTCLSDANPTDCDRAVIDVFVKEDQKIQAAQYEAVLHTPAKPTSTTTTAKVVSQPAPKTQTQVPPAPAPAKINPVQTPPPVAAKPAPAKPVVTPTNAKPAAPAKPVTPAPPIKPATPAPKPQVAPATKPPQPQVQAPAKTPDEDEDDSENEGVDEGDHASVYVGTLYQGADDLFDDSTKTTQKKGPAKILDQAVRLPYAGVLENGENLKDKNKSTNLTYIHPERDRGWGTDELVKMVTFIADTFKSVDGGILNVSDLSQKNGGHLTNSQHKSHQSGLDADLGYPVSDKSLAPFTTMVHNGVVDSRLEVDKILEIFKGIWKTKMLDRIFVDPAIKKSLCEQAVKKGEMDQDSEILRRLRPQAGHYNHFHVRIQCNKATQPRCRMMGEPPAGSGCPKS